MIADVGTENKNTFVSLNTVSESNVLLCKIY